MELRAQDEVSVQRCAHQSLVDEGIQQQPRVRPFIQAARNFQCPSREPYREDGRGKDGSTDQEPRFLDGVGVCGAQNQVMLQAKMMGAREDCVWLTVEKGSITFVICAYIGSIFPGLGITNSILLKSGGTSSQHSWKKEPRLFSVRLMRGGTYTREW